MKNYARDLNSNAVVSRDERGLAEYKKAKKIMKKKDQRILALEERLDKLEKVATMLLEERK